jgi:hypothetical protein
MGALAVYNSQLYNNLSRRLSKDTAESVWTMYSYKIPHEYHNHMFREHGWLEYHHNPEYRAKGV